MGLESIHLPDMRVRKRRPHIPRVGTDLAPLLLSLPRCHCGLLGSTLCCRRFVSVSPMDRPFPGGQGAGPPLRPGGSSLLVREAREASVLLRVGQASRDIPAFITPRSTAKVMGQECDGGNGPVWPLVPSEPCTVSQGEWLWDPRRRQGFWHPIWGAAVGPQPAGLLAAPSTRCGLSRLCCCYLVNLL